MQKVDSRDGLGERNDSARLTGLSKAELEPIVVGALREHRQLMESDQIVFDEWERARADCSIPLEQIVSLEAQCLERRRKSVAQQDRLSNLLDLLGYIPKVPGDCQEDS
jgi:hypothetical protein